MTTKGILSILLFLLTHVTLSQPVTIQISHLGKDDSTGKALFRIVIKNNSFEKYHVQDTAILQKLGFSNHSVVPFIDKKENGIYDFFSGFCGIPGVGLPDPCLHNCCTCMSLKKGEQIQFNLDLLSCDPVAKGDFRVKVILLPIIIPPEAKKGEINFESNYVYFTIK
jgi:hypothetical protein